MEPSFIVQFIRERLLLARIADSDASCNRGSLAGEEEVQEIDSRTFVTNVSGEWTGVPQLHVVSARRRRRRRCCCPIAEQNTRNTCEINLGSSAVAE
jgi:hypothetical protein